MTIPVNTQETTEGLVTDILTINRNNELIESHAFQQTLEQIPGYVGRANKLLADYRQNPSDFVAQIDEADLDEDLKEMAGIVKFSKTIDNNRKDIKNYFNGIRDEALSQLDNRLEQAQFNELKDAHNDVKQLKKDMQNQRISDRWKELLPVFNGSIQHYELIEELAPELLDFDRFRLIHQKMVSGAKTKPITETIRREVTQIVHEWNTALELIKANQWGLNANKQFELLRAFKANPSVGLVNQQGPEYKRQQDAEEERKRQELEARQKQEAEAKRLAEERKVREAELQKQQELARQAQTEKEKLAAEQRAKQLAEEAQRAQEAEQKRKAELEALIQRQVSPQARQSFPNIVEYLFTQPLYRELHTDARSKAAAIFDLSNQLTQPQSAMMKDTNGDPNKYLEAIRFVLDA